MPHTIIRTLLNLYVPDSAQHTVTSMRQFQDRGKRSFAPIHFLSCLFGNERVAFKNEFVGPVLGETWCGQIGMNMGWNGASGIRDWLNRAEFIATIRAGTHLTMN